MRNNHILHLPLFLTFFFSDFVLHAMEQNQTIMRVMTYNIRRKGKESSEERQWNNRLPLVTELIKRINPDIFGLQEATQEQINDLNKSITQYESFGQGRGTSWFGMGTDEHTPIFYKKERFEKLDHNTFFLNESTNTLGWMPWEYQKTGWLPRICTWGKFKDKQTGKLLYLYNTHLDHMYPQAQLLGLEQIKKLLPKDTTDLVIILGDFNTEFNQDMQNMLPNFRNAKQLAKQIEGPSKTRTGWDNQQLKNIDHILIKNLGNGIVAQYKVIAKESDKPYPSDHRPVVVELERKN